MCASTLALAPEKGFTKRTGLSGVGSTSFLRPKEVLRPKDSRETIMGGILLAESSPGGRTGRFARSVAVQRSQLAAVRGPAL